jgi:hypothetical protein
MEELGEYANLLTIESYLVECFEMFFEVEIENNHDSFIFLFAELDELLNPTSVAGSAMDCAL